MHKANSFITLTLDNEHMPADRSVSPRTWQLFAKKLRHARGAFRFYHCGEYGETWRAHYHAILFGIDWPDQLLHAVDNGNNIYTSAELSDLWAQGFVTTSDVTLQSCAYVARYCISKITGKKAAEHYRRDFVNEDTGECRTLDLKPPYATMSRRPGIGKAWYEKYGSDIYPRGSLMDLKGHLSPPPTYYDNLFAAEDPDAAVLLSEARTAAVGSKQRENSTPKRLLVRETVLKAKLHSLKRKLQ